MPSDIVFRYRRFPKSERRSYNLSMTTTESTALPPIDQKSWEEAVKNMLRAEMMRQGVSYAALAQRLALIGVEDNELNLKNKVGRGRFTAVFLMQCFKALGVDWIKVPASVEEAAKKGAAQGLAKRPTTPSEAK